jgi:co-chaperonin GroES (HSP10)
MAVKEQNKSGDKIINNAYNRGDVEFDAFKEVKIESEYLANNLGDNYSSEDYHRKRKLDEELYKILSESDV